MKTLNITINGKACTATEGQTILEACRDNGVFIPTLCHDERLNPFGSCNLCRIEVEGAKGTMLACGAAVTDGMVIRTETDAVNTARRVCVELLASQHYGDCKAPCSLACPAQVDIQGYVGHIANGRPIEAVKLIKERNPLPVVCGRICTRPCEAQCRRNILEGPIGIAYLKRYAADIDIKNPWLPEKAPATGKKAAIIGAGPAGLSAAWYLAIAGHAVTIYDKHPCPGGMLRYGIPSYRMPREALDAEVDVIKALGVEIVYNTEFGKDITVSSLKKDGFDSILLAVGSQVGQPLGVPGEENCPNVLRGVDFLGSVTAGNQPDFTDKQIVVVGGGNTAMDCSRTSMRLGAKDVTLVYRRTKAEMPADKMEIEESELEGVTYSMLTNPKSVRTENGKTIVTLVRMELGEPDASGRRSPKEIPGSEFDFEADYVISAIGQTQDLSFIGNDCAVSVDRNRLVADEKTGATNLPGIFAAGDAVSGPQTAILAIANGRKAALSMDQYMKGELIVPEKEFYNHVKAKHYSELDPAEFADYEKIDKVPMPMLTKEQRVHNFDEVELGMTEEQALREASRCLSCGCKDVDECKLREYATMYGAKQETPPTFKKHPIDESHPYIVRDPNKCIMCGRCVRICQEVQVKGVLGFIGRGYDVTVQPAFSRPFGEDLSCIKCGQCVSTCPVGALIEKVDMVQPGPYSETVVDSVCTYCSAGCAVELCMNGDKMIRTTAGIGKGPNNGNLCEKGRFKNGFINCENRLSTPMVRKNGQLVEASFAEALAAAAAGLEKGKDLAVYISGRATNEEAEALASIAAGRGSDNVTSYGVSHAVMSFHALMADKLVKSYDDFNGADLVVAIGADAYGADNVPAAAIRRAVRAGAKYLTSATVTDEIKAAVAAASAPIIFVIPAVSADVIESLMQLDAKFLVPAFKANAFGTAKFMNPNAQEASSSIIWGEDPVGYGKKLSGFNVVCDLWLTDTAKEANVVFPMGTFAENAGTFTNVFGMTQVLNRAVEGIDNMITLDALKSILGSAEAKKYTYTEFVNKGFAIPAGADVLEK